MREERLRQPLTGAASTTGVLALLVALASAAGCGGDGGRPADPAPFPVPGCESIDPTACDVRTTPCQMRLFAMAACLRGDQPGELPPVTVLSEADFAAILAADPAMTTPPPHLATWDWSLSALRLIQPGALAPQAMIAQTKQALGIYRHDTKDILIIDHGSDFDEQGASIVVVHEMVHALQDRAVGLSQLWSTFVTSGDNSLAIRSIIEGEARMQETRYEASALGLDPAKVDLMRRFENAVTRDETFLFMQPSVLTASSITFPYEWGARYVYFRWTAQGMNGVQALFQSPPVTTRVLMASVDQAVDPEAAPAPPDLPAPPADWVAAGTDTMGAWSLFLALEESATGTTVSELQNLALQWQADRLGIYEHSAGATAFAWRINLANEATAARVLALLQPGLPTISFRQQGTWVVAAGESDQQPGDWVFGP